eukprot:TRINITY_DN3496_c0_g2_i2.p1 TRINITY_DN3496_c0_g2~~TRINITY_DN3496_c0_g2_i2.p1  ORF type:complete len:307 (+),score=85.91 TRINITY_DN3496_c0_g2_i2:89-1009(+)
MADADPASARTSVAAVHHEIAKDIGQQVEGMILDAKQKSETMVARELKKIKTHLDGIHDKIRLVEEGCTRMESDGGGGLPRADLHESMQKLEEVWEGEVSTLKHELWQTIQAHNHNADLLKHHSDTIDQMKNRVGDSGPSPDLENVHAQLNQVDKILQRESTKEAQVDNFRNRLTMVQQQFEAMAGPSPPAPATAPGLGPFFGGGNNQAAAMAAALALASGASQGLPPVASSSLAAAGAAAGGGAGRQARGGNAPKKASAPAPKAVRAQQQRQQQAAAAAALAAGYDPGLSLRAEAPEFVPFHSDM